MFVKQLLPCLGLYQKWQRSKVGQRDKNTSPQLQHKQQELQEVLRTRCQNPWDATIRLMLLKSQQLRIFLKCLEVFEQLVSPSLFREPCLPW